MEQNRFNCCYIRNIIKCFPPLLHNTCCNKKEKPTRRQQSTRRENIPLPFSRGTRRVLAISKKRKKAERERERFGWALFVQTMLLPVVSGP